MVSILSREEFDSIEFNAAASGDHAQAARQMSMLAATGAESASMPRAEAFLRAGEQWLLADDPAQAVNGFRRAMADGGPVFVDPRVPLARALFQLGRQAEAQAIINRLKTEGPVSPRMCDMIAELLVERADLQAALDWATTGVKL
jgi:predicted Zn-dependent protease